MAPRLCLQAIPEHKDEAFLSKRWEDFDHSQKLGLGIWGTAWSIRDRETNERLVLQFCPQRSFNPARYRLLEIARRRADLFATPKYLFFRREQIYVCSEMAGISLAEVIDSTTLITEAQVATILKRVPFLLSCFKYHDSHMHRSLPLCKYLRPPRLLISSKPQMCFSVQQYLRAKEKLRLG